jgi:hypothetical protein
MPILPKQRDGWAFVRILALEHFYYYFDVVGLARCGHSSRNGRVWSSFLAYTNSKNALTPHAKEHPDDQTEKRNKEDQEEPT